MSLDLFNLHGKMILKELNKIFFIGGHNLSNICSADDIVLRGDSEQKLKELLGKIIKESEKKNWPSILRNSGEQNGQLKYGNYTLEMSKLNKCRNLDRKCKMWQCFSYND